MAIRGRARPDRLAEGSPPEGSPPEGSPPEPREATEWLRAHGVTLAAVTLIVAQLWWKAILLAHSYFRQDDYQYLDRGLASGFSWAYLMWVDAGHLIPIAMAIAWVLGRVSLYNWPLTSALTLLLLAAASFAMLRMLRTLFGNRPAILIPLGVFLFSPLSLTAASSWGVVVEMVPLELAMFMAVDAHVRYLRGGEKRHAVAAAGWLLLGLAATDKGIVVPLLLFALTAAFFVPDPGIHWVTAAVRAAVRYRRAWLLYCMVLAGYLAVFFVQLSGSTSQPGTPSSPGRVASLSVTMIESNLVPGALGGPWRWWEGGLGYAQAGSPLVLEELSWAVAVVIVIVSCLCRVHAWRAWAILFGWIAIADIVPVAIGRLQVFPATLLGVQTRYLTDATGVLALCVGLAFLPLAGEQNAYRIRASARRVRVLVRAAVVALVGVFLAGAVVSSQSLESATATTVMESRSYIATMRVALTHAPRGTTIVDGATPAYIMYPGFFWLHGYTSQVGGAIARSEPTRQLAWTESLHGPAGQLMIFNDRGQLFPAQVEGVSSWPPPPGKTCWSVAPGGTRIPLGGTLYRWPWTLRLVYSGPAGVLAVSFGGNSSTVTVPAGTHAVYVPVLGSGDLVTVELPDAVTTAACVTNLTVGTFQPDQAARPIPAAPVPG